METATDAFRALAYAMHDEPKDALDILRTLSDDDLNELTDGLDLLLDLARDVGREHDD